MNDDLEPRLRSAFRNGTLPTAPATLVEALERVPDAPATVRRSRTSRSIWAPLAVAAVLVVAGGVVIAGGQRGIAPAPTAPVTPAPALTPVPSAAIGNLQITYQLQVGAGGSSTAADAAKAVAVITERLASAGVVGPTVLAPGAGTIVVELPASIDNDAIRRLIGQTGHVDFVPLGDVQKEKGDTIDSNQFPALFTGDELETATIENDPTMGRSVTFILKARGATLFADYTAANIGKYFAIVLDSKVISAPVINSAIPGGHVQIQSGGIGGFPLDEAQQLVAVLRAGELPFPVLETSNEIVPASQSPTAP
jgi:protein-export membrane protein SecD